jgi:7,8-dihydropterin-6-yl-methyl-4-(beta-D-ribofuranosyl)aminobenzene 5'-phosphate synthase
VKIAHNLHPRPSGNIFLSASSGESEFPDNFSHELALAIKCEKGVAIFSPCTHSGIFNAIESCLEFTGGHNLLAFVGGLHLVDGCESEDEIASIAKYFTDKYPHAKLYTGHCTCDSAIKILEKKMGPGKFIMFATGDHYLLP